MPCRIKIFKHFNTDEFLEGTTDPHLIAFDAEHSNRDAFPGGCFNYDGFAYAAGEYEHDGLRAGAVVLDDILAGTPVEPCLIPETRKRPERSLKCLIELVAGAGFEPTTFGL